MRERIPAVVRHNPRGRQVAARGLWAGAEMIVTLGVILLLLVVHQLWWTNREAREGAERTVRALERDWDTAEADVDADADASIPAPGPADPADPADPETGGGPVAGEPGARTREGGRPERTGTSGTAPRWDRAYAVLRIPRIGLTAPVAQGVSKHGVLDKGYVGHYPRTAQPGQAGNFALAGHRNTHGEPFRRIDRLRRGDRITVETRDAVFTYTADTTLAQTTAGDSGVIAAVPRSNVKRSAGYSVPGYYLTLTTCTPEFTSRHRLVVWGKLTAMRPRQP